ncbi:MAG TPA: porin PorA family protein [Micromonosporaceae bacterium]|jgi:hypothetical protein
MNEPRGAEETARGRAGQPRPGPATERPRPATERPTQKRAARKRPLWPIPLALLGLLAIAVAAILAATANGRKQLPSDFNAVRQYSGTANSLVNAQALQAGDFGSAIVSNVPVTGQRTVRVVDTNGSNARVLDERSLATGTTQLGTTSTTYAVNRRSLEPATNAPQDWTATAHQGLAVGFPIGAKKQDYSGWIADTQTTSPIHFVREESRGGVNTYVYQQDTAPAPIRDQAVLSTLPSSLTRAQLQGITPSLPLSADQRTTLTQALPGLPDQEPVTYDYQASTTYWVEPTTGAIVDVSRQEIRTGTIAGPGGATLATLPVYNVSTRFTDDSVAAAGRYAADQRSTYKAVGRVWPWVLGSLGVLALIVALLGMFLRRRPRPAPATPEPTQRPTERAEPMRTARAGQARTGQARTEPTDEAAGKPRESRQGRPQPPYAGQTPHAGPYRESTTGQPPPNEEEFPTRGQPGQYPGTGKQPPHGGR